MASRSRSTSFPLAPENEDGYYVYLRTGEVQSVAPADSMEVSESELAIRLQGALVASFPRSRVFSCSRTPQSGPILG